MKFNFEIEPMPHQINRGFIDLPERDNSREPVTIGELQEKIFDERQAENISESFSQWAYDKANNIEKHHRADPLYHFIQYIAEKGAYEPLPGFLEKVWNSICDGTYISHNESLQKIETEFFAESGGEARLMEKFRERTASTLRMMRQVKESGYQIHQLKDPIVSPTEDDSLANQALHALFKSGYPRYHVSRKKINAG